MTSEQKAYGAHLALITRGPRGGPFRLAERYDRKRALGTYRSVAALERAIDRYGEQELRALKKRPRGPSSDSKISIRARTVPISSA